MVSESLRQSVASKVGTVDLRDNNRVEYTEHGSPQILPLDPTKVWTEQALLDFYEEQHGRRERAHNEQALAAYRAQQADPSTAPTMPLNAVVGWSLAQEVSYHVRRALCMATGRHRSAGDPWAYMLCANCPGDLYNGDWRKELGALRPGRLYWGQINRYREWLRGPAIRYPRMARLLGVWACPKCRDLQPAKYAGDCESCAMHHMTLWAAKSIRNRHGRRRKPIVPSQNTTP